MKGPQRAKENDTTGVTMGVYAREHAAEFATAGMPRASRYLHLTPAARIMLLHIASKVREDQDTTYVWDNEARYYESLGRKARALGYNVSPKMVRGSDHPDGVEDEIYNAVKSAVSRPMQELVTLGLLKSERKGRAGQNAEYSLPFLAYPCPRCRFIKDGKGAWSPHAHLPNIRVDLHLPDRQW